MKIIVLSSKLKITSMSSPENSSPYFIASNISVSNISGSTPKGHEVSFQFIVKTEYEEGISAPFKVDQDESIFLSEIIFQDVSFVTLL